MRMYMKTKGRVCRAPVIRYEREAADYWKACTGGGSAHIVISAAVGEIADGPKGYSSILPEDVKGGPDLVVAQFPGADVSGLGLLGERNATGVASHRRCGCTSRPCIGRLGRERRTTCFLMPAIFFGATATLTAQ